MEMVEERGDVINLLFPEYESGCVVLHLLEFGNMLKEDQRRQSCSEQVLKELKKW